MLQFYTEIPKIRASYELVIQSKVALTGLLHHIIGKVYTFLVLTFLGMLLLVGQANAADVYLATAADGGSAGNTGLSWASPKDGAAWLLSKINTVLPVGTKVYMKAGTYTYGTTGFLIGLNNNNVLVQGGFPHSATGNDLSGYDPIGNATIILLNTQSNVQVFGTILGTTTTLSELKGLQFTSSSTSFSNQSAFYAKSNGGGNYKFTDLYIHDLKQSNTAVNLGSMTASTAVFTNCLFYNNSGAGNSGAIYSNDGITGTAITINNSSFVQNSSASFGSGGAVATGTDMTINNSSFCSNSVQPGYSGGAIAMAATHATNPTLTITGSTFNSNTAYSGGAIYVFAGKYVVSTTNFYNNTAGVMAGALGQQFGAGLISTIDNCVFYRNQCTSGAYDASTVKGGGAISLYQTASGPNWVITNSKFVENHVASGNFGGAISIPTGNGATAGNIALDGCVFYNNYIGSSATATSTKLKGSDIIASVGVSAGTSNKYTVTNTSYMQLASAAAYLAWTGTGTSTQPYTFDATTVYSNTANNGGVIAPTFTCPTAINAVAVNVQGSVWNDADGNIMLNGLETGTNAGSVLYVNLVDATNTVIASTTVSAAGNYSLTAPASTTGLKLVLASSASATTPGTLPTNWVNTGESAGATNIATQGATLGQIELTTGATALTNQSFGIEQLPTPGSGTATVSNAGGITPVTIPPSAFTSTSPSTDTAPGSVTAIRITTFPSNVTSLTINGTTYTAATFPGGGLVVPTDGTGAPTAPILIDPTNDANPASFTFVAVDNAGKESTTWGTAMISFTGIPDLTPIIYALPSTLHNTTNITYVVDVVELKGVNSSGLITVKVTKDALTSMSFVSGATLVGGKSVQNSVWSFDNTDEDVYLFTTSASVVGGNKLSFGLSGVMSPGASTGTLTVSVVIVGGSGGEVRTTNNVDADKIDYFQQ